MAKQKTLRERLNEARKTIAKDWKRLFGLCGGAIAGLYTAIEIIGFFIDLEFLHSEWWFVVGFISLGFVIGMTTLLTSKSLGNPDIVKEVLKKTKFRVYISYYHKRRNQNDDYDSEYDYGDRIRRIVEDEALTMYDYSMQRFFQDVEILKPRGNGGDVLECIENQADMIVVIITHKYLEEMHDEYEKIKEWSRDSKRGLHLVPIVVHDTVRAMMHHDRCIDLGSDQTHFSSSDESFQAAVDDAKKAIKRASYAAVDAGSSDNKKPLVATPFNNQFIKDDELKSVKKSLKKSFEKLEGFKCIKLSDWFLDRTTDTSSALGKKKKHMNKVMESEIARDVEYIHRITDFWANRPIEDSCVQIKGTLSLYAPMIIGPPMMKRDTHLAFRTKKDDFDEDSLNASLAYSAGQMVERVRGDHHYYILGLYQGIVRNSIPVLVDPVYYFAHIANVLNRDNTSQSGRKSLCHEAKITGIVSPLPPGYNRMAAMKRWMASNAYNTLGDGVVENQGYDSSIVGLFIHGTNDKTKIEWTKEAKYLDGDIWCYVEKKTERGRSVEKKMFSRFGDLSNEKDIGLQISGMKAEIEKEFGPHYEIISQFDEVDKRFEDSME